LLHFELLLSPAEVEMEQDPKHPEGTGDRPLAKAPTSELLGQLAKESTGLVKKELELAKAELRSDIKREVATATDIAIAAALGLVTVNALIVAAVFGLAEWLPGWAAALIVAGLVLTSALVVGAIGWAKRVKRPLEKTQETLKEDVQWAKERLT
jgi:uncharacterized membrane protein YqjE